MELIVLDCIQWKCPEYDVQCTSTMSTGTALVWLLTSQGSWSVNPVSSSIPAQCFSGGDLPLCSCGAELEQVGTLMVAQIVKNWPSLSPV